MSWSRYVIMVSQQVFLKIMILKFYNVNYSMKPDLPLIKQVVKSYLTSFNTPFLFLSYKGSLPAFNCESLNLIYEMVIAKQDSLPLINPRKFLR